MPKNTFHNVFDPHYKVDISRNTQSMGLGLSVVKLLLEHMDGSYNINSRINEGTEITFQIPYIKQSTIRLGFVVFELLYPLS